MTPDERERRTRYALKYPDPILEFATLMDSVKTENSHKQGWDWMTPSACLKRLKDEVGELERAIKQNKSAQEIARECADVANFAMFTAYNTTEAEHDKEGL